MPKPITATGFLGMNNLPQAPATLLDDAKRITPRIALNVEATDGAKLIRREGYALAISLPGSHSLWAQSVMLVVANGTLYRIDGDTAVPIGTVSGLATPVCYEELDNQIYMATPAWEAIYDLLSGIIRPWGVSLPPSPNVSLTLGDMPPGTYSLCYTRASGDQLSGNGPITQITLDGETQGILLGNMASDLQCWITHPNGTDLFMADVVAGVIAGMHPKIIPLPSFDVAPPWGFSHFAQAFGRIWGCQGKKLVFSDSFRYEWFRTSNYKPFLEELIIVAPVKDGLFVNSLDSTWFLDGTNPAQMVIKRIGDGAVPGTLVYANLPGAVVGGGYEMSRRLSQLPSPVWVGKHGFVIGTQTGHLVHLTESRLWMPIRSHGGSLFRMKQGVPQVITVLWGPLKNEDPKPITSAFKTGALF